MSDRYFTKHIRDVGERIILAGLFSEGALPRQVSLSMKPINRQDADQDQLVADLREAFGVFEAGMAGDGDGECGLPDLQSMSMRGSSNFGGVRWSAGGIGPGRRLGDFEIITELGRGGMGTVYRARQVSLDRDVALKVLPDYAHRGRVAIQRFRTEAQAAARLHHTNIVPIYAQGEADGKFFYAMELIEGESLHTAIKSRSRSLSAAGWGSFKKSDVREDGIRKEDGPGSSSVTDSKSCVGKTNIDESAGRCEPEAVCSRSAEDYRHIARIVAGVAEGLEHAHEKGVIHRDIKPQNLLMGEDRRLHITDFGLARLANAPGLTITGEVMGTPAYLSPEQVRADQRAVDHRTDVYSLGVTLYELLTLRRPFEGESRDQVLSGICMKEPVSPRSIDDRIPKDLQTICLKAMDKDPSGRYGTAGQMAEDLRRYADGRPILSRPAGPLLRAVKWSRRHKAASVAIFSIMLVFVLAGSLAMAFSTMRRSAAEQLLTSAYDRLVYLDYRRSDEVTNDLLKASELGADENRIAFLMSLMSLMRQEFDAAERTLAPAINAEPDNAEFLYLMAAIQDRSRREPIAHETVVRADAIPDRSATAWFLRGIALHYAYPQEAITCYRQARQIRATQGEVFLQATLQLARANNQNMYANRSIDDFSDAASALEQLIEYEVYKGYPYYLLSTTHRLAGEIYSGSKGTRDESLAQEHYLRAIEAAKKGQEVDPDNPSPYSAEAFVLESMGRYAEAESAHSETIRISGNNRDRYCEAHHYRWRLRFWQGDYDGALADIESHCDCPVGDNAIYSHFYPALVFASRGDIEKAIEHAYAISEESPSDPLAAIWTASCLRLLGQSDRAVEYLDSRREVMLPASGKERWQSEQWVEGLWSMVAGDQTCDALLALARDEDKAWRMRGEASFHAALVALSNDNRGEAMELLEQAYRSFDSELDYTFHAKVLLRQFEQEEGWPAWIPSSGVDLGASVVVKQ